MSGYVYREGRRADPAMLRAAGPLWIEWNAANVRARQAYHASQAVVKGWPADVRRAALLLLAAGSSALEVSAHLNVPASTIRSWREKEARRG